MSTMSSKMSKILSLKMKIFCKCQKYGLLDDKREEKANRLYTSVIHEVILKLFFVIIVMFEPLIFVDDSNGNNGTVLAIM